MSIGAKPEDKFPVNQPTPPKSSELQGPGIVMPQVLDSRDNQILRLLDSGKDLQQCTAYFIRKLKSQVNENLVNAITERLNNSDQTIRVTAASILLESGGTISELQEPKVLQDLSESLHKSLNQKDDQRDHAFALGVARSLAYCDKNFFSIEKNRADLTTLIVDAFHHISTEPDKVRAFRTQLSKPLPQFNQKEWDAFCDLLVDTRYDSIGGIEESVGVLVRGMLPRFFEARPDNFSSRLVGRIIDPQNLPDRERAGSYLPFLLTSPLLGTDRQSLLSATQDELVSFNPENKDSPRLLILIDMLQGMPLTAEESNNLFINTFQIRNNCTLSEPQKTSLAQITPSFVTHLKGLGGLNLELDQHATAIIEQVAKIVLIIDGAQGLEHGIERASETLKKVTPFIEPFIMASQSIRQTLQELDSVALNRSTGADRATRDLYQSIFEWIDIWYDAYSPSSAPDNLLTLLESVYRKRGPK